MLSQSGGVSVGAAVGAVVGAADGAIVALFVALSDTSAAATADAASVSRVLRLNRRRILADKFFALPVGVTPSSRLASAALMAKRSEWVSQVSRLLESSGVAD